MKYVETYKLGDNLGDCLAGTARDDGWLRQAQQDQHQLSPVHTEPLLEQDRLQPGLPGAPAGVQPEQPGPPGQVSQPDGGRDGVPSPASLRPGV